MKFNVDKKFTSFRTILSFIWIIIIVVSIFAIQDFKYRIWLTFVLASLLLISLFIIFFTANSVCKAENDLIIKNIFGFIIKRIKHDQILGKKIIFKNVPFNGIGIFKLSGLTEKKYENFILVKLELENEQKYSFNGQILSAQGLEKFNSFIRK